MRTTDILVIDDEQTLLDELAEVLSSADRDADDGNRDDEPPLSRLSHHVSFARQGLDGVRVHREALQRKRPMAVAFVDDHMPPGIEGIETVAKLWEAQPDLEIVLCTAHPDESWRTICDRFDHRGQLVILRKPFEPIEVRQLAACLSEKWVRGRALAARIDDLRAQIGREIQVRMEHDLEATRKFEALGRVAAGMIHEIASPMQYIITNIELLTGSLEQAIAGAARGETAYVQGALHEMIDAVGEASLGARQILAIMKTVREYSHTRRTPERVHERLDVNDQIRMVAQLAAVQFKTTVTIDVELGTVCPVLGDADVLGRSLLNLVVNAAHAVEATSHRGSVRIRSMTSGSDVVIEVADTGVGIPLEDHAKIFEPFFTTKPRGHGTGQGLALAREAIEVIHRGRLSFESAPGVGTVFRIHLPCTSAHAL